MSQTHLSLPAGSHSRRCTKVPHPHGPVCHINCECKKEQRANEVDPETCPDCQMPGMLPQGNGACVYCGPRMPNPPNLVGSLGEGTVPAHDKHRHRRAQAAADIKDRYLTEDLRQQVTGREPAAGAESSTTCRYRLGQFRCQKASEWVLYPQYTGGVGTVLPDLFACNSHIGDVIADAEKVADSNRDVPHHWQLVAMSRQGL